MVSPIVVGSVISDRVLAHRLAVCPFMKRVLWNRRSSLDVFGVWNSCSLGSHHCSSRGRRLKFKPCFGGVRVVWVCPDVVGLPDVEI